MNNQSETPAPGTQETAVQAPAVEQPAQPVQSVDAPAPAERPAVDGGAATALPGFQTSGPQEAQEGISPSAKQKLDEVSAALANAGVKPFIPYPHLFTSEPTLLDPLGQKCNMEGCNLTEFAHPEETTFKSTEDVGDEQHLVHRSDAGIEASADKMCNVENCDVHSAGGGSEAFLKAIAKTPIESLEDRVAALEQGLAEMAIKLKHHGITGPR